MDQINLNENHISLSLYIYITQHTISIALTCKHYKIHQFNKKRILSIRKISMNFFIFIFQQDFHRIAFNTISIRISAIDSYMKTNDIIQ